MAQTTAKRIDIAQLIRKMANDVIFFRIFETFLFALFRNNHYLCNIKGKRFVNLDIEI